MSSKTYGLRSGRIAMLLCCTALLVTAAEGGSAVRNHRAARDAANGGAGRPDRGPKISCERVNHFFASINVTVGGTGQGFPQTKGPVCEGVCCDAETETQLQAKATKNFERLVKHHIRSRRGHWEQTAALYKDFLLQLSRQSENKTLTLFSTVYSKMSPLSREPIRELYETIRLNLVADRPFGGDDLELVTDKFFRNLFPVAYHHAIHSTGDAQSRNDGDGSSNRDFHSDYKNCLVHMYNDLQPFGSVPRELASSLMSSVSAASVLLRVLRDGADVLTKLEEIGVTSPSCKKALLRMNYCGSCHLFDHLHAKPCAGLCHNVMRGCLAEYVGLLNKDWSTFTESIVPLIRTVQSPQGVESEIKQLDAKLSTAIMKAMESGPQLEQQVEQACGVPSLMQTDYLVDGSFEDVPKTLPSSSQFILAPSNEMLHFEMTIVKNKDLLLQLSSTLCNDEDYHPTDQDCWTGSSLSDYTQQVVQSTIGDKYNPEVAYAGDIESPHMRTLVDRLINLNSAATKASSPNTYRGDVDKMQSDMAEGSGDSYPSDDEEDGFAASGSGDGRSITQDSSVIPVISEINSSKRISSHSCWSLMAAVSAMLLSVPMLQLHGLFYRH
ncbi:division abnormally delayed protein [Anopheles bellator]|uniref:division abnormally delayed protein n=1 Tax=Anopheles bellator TaxID=139047 RepID=UPI00264824FC|nr:division abnormally delayed protein [Anopheles bellator]